jgi:hypothetical protein
MTRFARHRSSSFGSFADSQNHRTPTKLRLIEPSMKSPMPRSIYESLVTNAPPRNRETETMKLRERSAKRFGTRNGDIVAGHDYQ